MPYRKYIRKGFAVVEVMIVFAIIALHVASAVPGFLWARKRSQALKIPSELRTADSALDPIATI